MNRLRASAPGSVEPSTLALLVSNLICIPSSNPCGKASRQLSAAYDAFVYPSGYIGVGEKSNLPSPSISASPTSHTEGLFWSGAHYRVVPFPGQLTARTY